METKKKILIIEDDPQVLQLISLILTQEGYHVIKAGNGAEALRKIVQDYPEMIIADLILPDMNGAEVIQDARDKHACNAPVIFLTGMITKDEETAKDMKIKIKDTNYTV